MGKPTKLPLQSLRIQSFVTKTNVEARTIKAGSFGTQYLVCSSETTPYINCC